MFVGGNGTGTKKLRNLYWGKYYISEQVNGSAVVYYVDSQDKKHPDREYTTYARAVSATKKRVAI